MSKYAMDASGSMLIDMERGCVLVDFEESGAEGMSLAAVAQFVEQTHPIAADSFERARQIAAVCFRYNKLPDDAARWIERNRSNNLGMGYAVGEV